MGEITPEGIADAVGREVSDLVRQIKAGNRTREEAVRIMGELGDAIYNQAGKEES